MSKYFGYRDDIDEFKYSSGAGKLGLLGKMALKTVANVGIFAVTELPKAMINEAAEKAGRVINNENATDEQKQKARKVLDTADQFNQKYNK
ncbi:hypothetical protein ACWIUH_02670 [Ursidibacter arcticus]